MIFKNNFAIEPDIPDKEIKRLIDRDYELGGTSFKLLIHFGSQNPFIIIDTTKFSDSKRDQLLDDYGLSFRTTINGVLYSFVYLRINEYDVSFPEMCMLYEEACEFYRQHFNLNLS